MPTHTYIYIYIYIHLQTSIYPPILIYKKLATVVEGEQTASFSIATTPRCRMGCWHPVQTTVRDGIDVSVERRNEILASLNFFVITNIWIIKNVVLRKKNIYIYIYIYIHIYIYIYTFLL